MTRTNVAAPERGTLIQRLDPSALWTLFVLSLRQNLRARRLGILMGLFAVPALLAVVVRLTAHHYQTQPVEVALVFSFIPHALVPLAALLYGSGMIQDEQEEQTLTYLLVRPLPRWAVYFAKLLAAIVVTVGLACIFTLITYVAIFIGEPVSWTGILLRALQACALLALSMISYCSIFGCISLIARRSFVVGVAYIVLFEGVIANIDFIVRKLTIMYYFRVLADRWLNLNQRGWSLNLYDAPSAASCVWTLIMVSMVATCLAAVFFTTREFRVKTPEGN